MLRGPHPDRCANRITCDTPPLQRVGRGELLSRAQQAETARPSRGAQLWLLVHLHTAGSPRRQAEPSRSSRPRPPAPCRFAWDAALTVSARPLGGRGENRMHFVVQETRFCMRFAFGALSPPVGPGCVHVTAASDEKRHWCSSWKGAATTSVLALPGNVLGARRRCSPQDKTGRAPRERQAVCASGRRPPQLPSLTWFASSPQSPSLPRHSCSRRWRSPVRRRSRRRSLSPGIRSAASRSA